MNGLVLMLALLAGTGPGLPNEEQPGKRTTADPSALGQAVAPRVRPRLFVAERDPFSGLPALKARWAAGERPAEDLPGLALSWLLSGDESYARRDEHPGVGDGRGRGRSPARREDEGNEQRREAEGRGLHFFTPAVCASSASPSFRRTAS